ncbi:aldo/keto reductase [Nesterenkonia sandarakina]|uniref:Aryl-alcohol dehydrogenase-like predicted oxidoreductase n=1 Tax=Nesterenkonia sandarakina TaxID=272918 RepID=A0A2T0YGG9_9MICC|nr:aldo/keto reductase [Nesterenkonia sandarakina]PRZ14026.1 aryl-alcohol dehydrogenase-like predicted oxidoreductase [Nesterenkonia sandarakina]
MTLRSITLGTGQHQLETSALGYGAMSLAGAYGAISEADSLELLDHVARREVTFLDTANIYGDGESERVLGTFLKHRREEFVLATKVGIEKGAGVGKRRARGDAAYIKDQIDQSLRRLGTDHVDLYYLHRVDPETPIEESVGALGELVTAGKVRAIGLSEATGDEIARGHAVHPITAVQSEWSIFARDVEAHVLPTCARLGIGFVPYSPVGRGLLTDSFDAKALPAEDIRQNFPWFMPENLPQNASLLEQVRAVAARLDLPTAGLALAWLYQQASALGVQISPIPGTRTAAHWDELQHGVDVALPGEALAELDALAGQVSGDRSFDPRWVSGGREGLLPRS